ncbi:MAG: glycosyltransferase family 9 protein [Desulfobacteraceae bacterium]|nr:glycosyltransferase family 9 protein [Desulfobacteraceae bacterium]
MKINTKILIDSFIGQLICRFIDLINFFSFKSRKTIKPDKICIILLSEMGSLTVTFPMIQIVKEKYPNSDVYILTLKRNDEIIKIMNLAPEQNIITIDDSSLIKFILDSYKSIRYLRAIATDTIIDCELFARISSIYSYFSGAKIRVGFHSHTQDGLYRGNHINRKVLYNPYIHISRQFLNLADALESKEYPKNKNRINNNNFKVPQITISEKEKTNFKDRIESKFSDFLKRPIVIINPGGGMLPIRAWPVENYCIVARSLLKSGYSVAVTGVSHDKEPAEQILATCKSPYCADMVGFTRSVYELLILFTFSKLLITNDGGPGHFSCLTSLPSIILFGPETPVLYGSLNPNATNIQADISCSPCLTAYNHRKSPCNGNNLCLKAIKPEQVLNKASEVLSLL